jgi:hypothetical protein
MRNKNSFKHFLFITVWTLILFTNNFVIQLCDLLLLNIFCDRLVIKGIEFLHMLIFTFIVSIDFSLLLFMTVGH